MLPPPRPKLEYEKVVVDEWLLGEIQEIEYDLEHKSTFNGKEKTAPAVKIKMTFDGYEFPKSSGWMSFIYDEKSKLYKTYIVGLVANPVPYMEFDLDALKGMKIKGMWETNIKNPEYQNLVRIRPVGEKVAATAEPAEDAPEADPMPF